MIYVVTDISNKTHVVESDQFETKANPAILVFYKKGEFIAMFNGWKSVVQLDPKPAGKQLNVDASLIAAEAN